MARTKRNTTDSQPQRAMWRAALYTRLSREDDDKIESDSIANQKKFLEDFIAGADDLQYVDLYADDGYTGTNFERPDFKRLLSDIESGKINCVVVKDLSRFGRNYVAAGFYLEQWFPEHGVRFIAVNDLTDSSSGGYDMLLPVKNVFNEHYARDISRKVRSSFIAKQRRGEFVGAFASYGYRKDPENHNKLVIDPIAADVVKRIFSMFESGNGKIKIAKTLNAEGIPCPSEYKKLNGERYTNGQKLKGTTYWTYSTIHRILHNQMYAGNMEQGRTPRQSMHGKAKKADPSQWITVEGTHEAIISKEQWERVQSLLQRDTKNLNFNENISPFAGFLRCGDCGRAMSKTAHPGGVYYCCGSYKRYGPTVCSRHGLSHCELEQVVLDDLNKIISAVEDLKALADEVMPQKQPRDLQTERNRLTLGIERLYRLKKSAYEDYKDGMLSKEDYLRFADDYQSQTEQLQSQLDHLEKIEEPTVETPWIDALLAHGQLTELDRATVAEAIKEIRIFEGKQIEITYTFSDDLGILNT